MEIVACVVGVADVTARASSKIWRLCELWKDAPQDVFHLRDELDRSSRFFEALKIGMQQPLPASPSQTVMVDLTSLLNQGHGTVSALQALFDELLIVKTDAEKGSSHGLSSENVAVELGKRRRVGWLKRFHRIKRLRNSLRQTTDQIGLYLSLLNVTLTSGLAQSEATHSQARNFLIDVSHSERPSQTLLLPPPSHHREAVKENDITLQAMSERIDNSLSKLEHNIMEGITRKLDSHTRQIEQTRALVIGIRNDIELKSQTWQFTHQTVTSAMSDTSAAVNIPPALCRQDCNCACHSIASHSSWQVSGWSWTVFGSLRLAFTSTIPQTCSDPSCRMSHREPHERRRGYLAMQYSLPSWISSTIFSLYAKSNFGGPELLLRISNVVDPQRNSTDNTIFQSAMQADIDGVKTAIAARPSCVNDIIWTGSVGRARRTPLSLAISLGLAVSRNADMVRLLVRAGADVRFEETQGLSLLQSAFRRFLSGRPGCETLPDILPFEELVEDEGFTMLHKIACRMAPLAGLNQEQLGRPTMKGMVNAKTTSGMTPLHLAALAGNLQVVRLLLDSSADPNALSDSKTTPIRLALLGTRPDHNPETVRILLAAGAKINTTTDSGTSSLHLLCENTSFSEKDRLDLLKRLISHGADINATTTTYQRTPLDRAAGLNNFCIVPHLLYHGADINHQDWEGDTALNEAIYSRSYETAEFLLSHGANYRLRSHNGDTMLHLVARYGDKRILDIVERAGIWDVDANAANNAGQTAMDVLARQRGVDEQFRYGFLRLVGSVIAASKRGQGVPTCQVDSGDMSSEEDEVYHECE